MVGVVPRPVRIAGPDRSCDGCGCAYGRWDAATVGHEGVLCNVCWMCLAAPRPKEENRDV